jgi:hypothetical protein
VDLRGFFYLLNFLKMDFIEFTCKLSPESEESLIVGTGETMLFSIYRGSTYMEVGLNKEDIDRLIPLLLKFYYNE